MVDAHMHLVPSMGRSTPPHTPLTSSFRPHPWGPTTVPPAPKIVSRARPLPTSQPSSGQQDPFSDATSAGSHTLATAAQLSSRMTSAIHREDSDMAMQLDDEHTQPPTAHIHRRDSASSSGYSGRSSSDFFNAGLASSSSSRTTLSESPAAHNRSASSASKSRYSAHLNTSPRFRDAVPEAMIPAQDPMNPSSPLLSDLQPAFTPLPARRYSNRNRRAASPNEPIDSDEEERMCLRFDPAMLHRSPEFGLPRQQAPLNPAFSIQKNVAASPPTHVLQEIQQDINMDFEDETLSHPQSLCTPPDAALTLELDTTAPSSVEPVTEAASTPESPALRTRSRTRIAAAAAAAAASASAALSRHTKSGSASSQANVPVRMSSLSSILNTATQQEPQAASAEPAENAADEAAMHEGKSQQRKQNGQTPLAVRTRRQTQREREERSQQVLPQRTPHQAQPRQQSMHPPRLNALPPLAMGAATLACAPSSPTASLRRKQRNGRMRAFDPTPSPSPPPPSRAALHHAAAARRSKSPSPYYTLPNSNVSMVSAYAHHGGSYDPAAFGSAASTGSHGMDEEHVLNPTFPLPLGGGRNGHSHSHPRSSRPRRMSSRCSPGAVRASTPVMSSIPIPGPPMSPSHLTAAATLDGIFVPPAHSQQQAPNSPMLDMNAVAMEH